MTDITVQEIIDTFKGKQRDIIYSSAKSDDFLDIIKKKQHWTLEEFKLFSLEYALENMHVSPFDRIAMLSIIKKYNFQLDWYDYFNVLDNIKSITKKSKYLNYYFWYYHTQMNETIYQQLMNKPYFYLLKSKSKSTFLQHSLNTNNSHKWINKYCTAKEIENAFKMHSFHIGMNLDESGIKNLKDFYNEYESLMSTKIKAKFYYKLVLTGSTPLLTYFYKEKQITKLNNVILLWHVCSDISANNTLEILDCLKNLGIKFNKQLLQKVQAHPQWGYMEYTDQLLDFFDNHVK